MHVFVHVAEDAARSSQRSTRAYAYVYLWRSACFFVMQHLKRGSASSAGVHAYVFSHVAEDASGSSYRSTRAYAYVYLWRRTCFFVMQHLKRGTGKPEKKPAIMTRSAEITNARYEDVIRTDMQCILTPPSPKLQCWFSSMSRLPPTLNSRGAGFINVHLRYLALKQRVFFFRVYRSRVRAFEGVLSTSHHFGFTGLGLVHSKAFCPPPITYGSLPAPA